MAQRGSSEASSPLYDPTALPRVLSLTAAQRAGYSRSAIAHRVRAGRWRRPLPRVLLTDDTLLWRDRLAAALTFAGPASVLSAAAALDDLGLRSVRRPGRILVLVPSTSRTRSTAWVQVRPTARLPEPAIWPGPRRAPFARSVADLSLTMRREDDVRMLVAESTRHGLCSVEELEAELLAGPRKGSALLRLALEDARGAWSAPEARAARLLRRAGLHGFEQNAEVRLPTGKWRTVDFLWRALRAILEIDSDAHHALAGDQDVTSDRHIELETAGFSVIHRTPRLIVRQPARFVTGVDAWLAARRLALGAESAVPGR